MSSDDNDDDANQASNKRKIESIDADTTHKKKTKKVKSKKIFRHGSSQEEPNGV
jgi:hypothetical protein